jgi:hypothetical protein
MPAPSSTDVGKLPSEREKPKLLPDIIHKVQFRSEPDLSSFVYTGAQGTGPTVTSYLWPYMVIRDFVAVHNAQWAIRITDTFDRRYQSEDRFNPLDHWTLYPGLGNLQPMRVERPLGNYDNQTTRLRFEFSKLIPGAGTIDMATLVTAPWYTSDYAADKQLAEPSWWEYFHQNKKHFEMTNNVNLNGGNLNGDSFIYKFPGPMLIMGMNWTGGANIKIQAFNSGQGSGIYLVNPATRIDLIASCFGLPGNVGQGWQWPGAFYVPHGDEIQITVTNITGLPINEYLTLWGYTQFRPEERT